MEITILDGGMGQELLSRNSSRPTGLWSARFLMDAPDLVRSVHADYLAAGADVITTNSFVLHRDRLAPFGVEDQFETLHRVACRLAMEARDAHGAGLIAGSLGPNAGSYRPDAVCESGLTPTVLPVSRLRFLNPAQPWMRCKSAWTWIRRPMQGLPRTGSPEGLVLSVVAARWDQPISRLWQSN